MNVNQTVNVEAKAEDAGPRLDVPSLLGIPTGGDRGRGRFATTKPVRWPSEGLTIR